VSIANEVRSTLSRAVVATALLFAASWSAAPAAAIATTNACDPIAPFTSSAFSHPLMTDSRWFPLVPGTQFTLEGRADQGGAILPHRVVFTVTDLTKVIDGVATRVIWDRDFAEDELVEAELAFFAQDDDANVWTMGEYPEEYEDGAFAGAPSTWIGGVDGAEAGVLVPGRPALGSSWYLQGVAPAIDFLDCAKVFKTGQSVCVPVACYSDVLVIDEKSPLEPGSGSQRKYYAPGVGDVQVGAVGDKEGETLVLIDVTRLGRQGLAAADRAALQLEKRAYAVSDAYSQTAPIVRPRG
jgi:hypothetical protein